MPFKITDKNSFADIGLQVEADNLNDLFCQAAYGISEITADSEGIGDDIKREIHLTAESLVDLFYNWMSELIYLKDAELLLIKRCQVTITGKETYKLKAVLLGDCIDQDRHILKLDLKAVTYYNFRIEEIDNRWYGEVVFDL